MNAYTSDFSLIVYKEPLKAEVFNNSNLYKSLQCK